LNFENEISQVSLLEIEKEIPIKKQTPLDKKQTSLELDNIISEIEKNRVKFNKKT
jgi:hypothetical protein